jgi:hypothetical protein
VPLSEREKKILDEIERNLYQEDPSFARGVRRRFPRLDEGRRLKLGALTFLCGLVLLLGFFITRGALIVGVAAFGAMVGGIVLVAGSIRALTESSRRGDKAKRERLNSVLGQWEQRIRRRFKRP